MEGARQTSTDRSLKGRVDDHDCVAEEERAVRASEEEQPDHTPPLDHPEPRAGRRVECRSGAPEQLLPRGPRDGRVDPRLPRHSG